LGLNSLQLLRLAGRATAQLATYLSQHPDQAGVLTVIFHQAQARRFRAWERVLRQILDIME
jgi:hypothetical protein